MVPPEGNVWLLVGEVMVMTGAVVSLVASDPESLLFLEQAQKKKMDKRNMVVRGIVKDKSLP